MHAGCKEVMRSRVNAVYSDSAGSTRGSFRIGSTVTQTCDVGNGFVASGCDDTVIRICTTSGWSNVSFTCQR